MHVLIAVDGTLSLQEAEDFKNFSIVAADPELREGGVAEALGEMVEPAEDNHYWMDADAVIALSPRKDDTQWCDAFWAMLEKAVPHGYADLEKRRVKAHVQ